MTGKVARRQDGRDARPVIGVMIAEVESWWSQAFLSEAVEAAEAADVNLICFVGMLSPGMMGYGVHDLVGAERLDGVMVLGNVAYGGGAEALEAFVERLRAPHGREDGMPMVSVVAALPGVPSVWTDGLQGMDQAVSHLIEVHGYRRIAFVQGPEDSPEAEARYQGYVQALERHGIALDPALVVSGDYSAEAGREAVRYLWGAGVEVDAIVAADDVAAMGVMDELREQGVRVPEDVAVVGFDDDYDGRYLDVPLTTVRQPMGDLVRYAFDLLLRQLRGEQVQKQTWIPTSLMVRQSCGCLPVVLRGVWMLDELIRGGEKEALEGIPSVLPSVPQERVEEVWRRFWEEVRSPTSSGDAFLHFVAQELRHGWRRATPLRAEVWHALLYALWDRLRAASVGVETMRKAGRILRDAHFLIRDAGMRWIVHRHQVGEPWRVRMNSMEAMLSTVMGLEELEPVVEEGFPSLEMVRCGVAYYGEMGDGVLEPPEEASLLLWYDRSQRSPARVTQGERFEARRLLPDEVTSGDRFTWLVFALSVQERRLGHMVVEIGPRVWQLYYRLASAFSALLSRFRLMREAEAARREAEAALRDLVAVQRRYVRRMWEVYARRAAVKGYVRLVKSDGRVVAGADDEAWLPVMAQAVEAEGGVISEDGHALAVPMRLRGEMVGVIGFEREEGREPWTADHLSLVEEVVEHAAVILESYRLLDELQHRAALLADAAEVSRVASSITDVDELLTRVVSLITERFGFYYVGIFLVDADRRWAVLRVGSGEAGRRMVEQGHRLEVAETSMVGACVLTGEARIAQEAERERVRRRNPLLPETRSELALPLRSRGQVIGAMTIQSTEPRAFSQEDIAVLQTMADQLGNAIENARLFEEMALSRRELELASGKYTEEAWRDFVEQARHTLGYRAAMPSPRLSDIRPVEEPRPEARQALAQQRPVVTLLPVEGEEGRMYTAVGVPIRFRDQVLGVLNVRFEEGAVPEERMMLLEQLAARLGVALENARLLEESRRSAARERLLSRVAERMRASLEVEAVLRSAVREIRAALDLANVTVRLAPRSEE